MELSGLEDLVELRAEFHFWCLHVSWWFIFWKRGPIFNVQQFMPSVRTPLGIQPEQRLLSLTTAGAPVRIPDFL